MLTSLSITRFKGIEELKFSDFKRFNIFIGKNDSSKTTVLEAIYSLKASLITEPPELQQILRQSQGREQINKNIWYNGKTEDKIIISMEIFDAECFVTFTSDYQGIGTAVNVEVADEIEKKYEMNETFSKCTNEVNGESNELLNNQLQNMIFNTIYITERFTSNITNWDKEDSEPCKYYNDNVSSVKWADYTREDKRLQVRTKDRDRFADTLGEGHKSGLALAMMINKLKSTIVLIDEIENHHHSSSLRKIVKMLIEQSTKNNLQIFLTTHSPEIIQLFSQNEETKIFHMINKKNKIRSNEIQYDDMKLIRDIGIDVGSLLKFETIIIVEGITDEIILRQSIYKLTDSLPEELGIRIICAGSYTKQKELIKTLVTENNKLFVQRDLDNNSSESIKNTIMNSFKELQRDGFEIMPGKDDEIRLENKKRNQIKVLSSSRIIVTGDSDALPEIENHAIEDYLLLMIKKQESIVTDILEMAGQNPLEFKGKNGKEVLNRIFENYDVDIACKIIALCDKSNFPENLKKIVNDITNNSIV